MLNQYLMLQNLGKGTSGKVKLALDTDKNRLVAIKIVRKPRMSQLDHSTLGRRAESRFDALTQEVELMKRLRHRNIVTLFEVIDDPEAEKLYLVMQYVEEGPLAVPRDDLVACSKERTYSVPTTLSLQQIVAHARQICSALEYLHQQGISHGDIKPENILRGSNDQVYLADFGVAHLETLCDNDGLPDSEHRENIRGSHQQHAKSFGGTPLFMAPELLRFMMNPTREFANIDKNVHDAIRNSDRTEDHDCGTVDFTDDEIDRKACDLWALGCTLFILLEGHLPFVTTESVLRLLPASPLEQWRRASKVELPQNEHQAAETTLRALINDLLSFYPSDRPTARQCKRCLKSLAEALSRCEEQQAASDIAANAEAEAERAENARDLATRGGSSGHNESGFKSVVSHQSSSLRRISSDRRSFGSQTADETTPIRCGTDGAKCTQEKFTKVVEPENFSGTNSAVALSLGKDNHQGLIDDQVPTAGNLLHPSPPSEPRKSRALREYDAAS